MFLYRLVDQIFARSKNDRDEVERLKAEEYSDLEMIDDEIYQLQNNHLIKRAHQYLLPVPEFQTEGGSWEESNITSKWRLTQAALLELRAAIRREERERREQRQMLIAWLSAITGVFGALTGLVAVLHR